MIENLFEHLKATVFGIIFLVAAVIFSVCFICTPVAFINGAYWEGVIILIVTVLAGMTISWVLRK